MHERRPHEDPFPRASLNGEQLDEFREIIAPLEERAGRPLGGPGRRLCLQAFDENPHGFSEVAADAWIRGDNPLALLITIVRAGEHREIVPTPEVPIREVAATAQGWETAVEVDPDAKWHAFIREQDGVAEGAQDAENLPYVACFVCDKAIRVDTAVIEAGQYFCSEHGRSAAA